MLTKRAGTSTFRRCVKKKESFTLEIRGSSLLVGKSQKLSPILSEGQMFELTVATASVEGHTNHHSRTDHCHYFLTRGSQISFRNSVEGLLNATKLSCVMLATILSSAWWGVLYTYTELLRLYSHRDLPYIKATYSNGLQWWGCFFVYKTRSEVECGHMIQEVQFEMHSVCLKSLLNTKTQHSVLPFPPTGLCSSGKLYLPPPFHLWSFGQSIWKLQKYCVHITK